MAAFRQWLAAPSDLLAPEKHSLESDVPWLRKTTKTFGEYQRHSKRAARANETELAMTVFFEDIALTEDKDVSALQI